MGYELSSCTTVESVTVELTNGGTICGTIERGITRRPATRGGSGSTPCSNRRAIFQPWQPSSSPSSPVDTFSAIELFPSANGAFDRRELNSTVTDSTVVQLLNSY